MMMKVKFKTIERAKAKKQAQAHKHAPLPWRSDPEYLSAERKARTYYTIIFSGDGKFMARVLDNEAAFIVQACNSHYELLEACKLSVEMLQEVLRTADNDTANIVDECLQKIHAAIEKAGQQ
jgi:hypothetical protein